MNKQFQLVAVTVFFTLKLYGQITIPNAGFEESDKTTRTKTKYWIAESDNFICTADNHQTYKGNYSMKVSSKTEGNHFFNLEFPFTTEELRKYKIKCAFKTSNLQGSIQFGVRVFGNGEKTTFKTAFMLTENIDQEWTTIEREFITDESASKLRLFFNLSGKGEAWLDEISIEAIQLPTKQPRTEVELYIHQYFDIVYENSIINNKNFISNLKSETMYLCADSADMNECRFVLQHYTTKRLNENDGHSFFTLPEEWKAMIEHGKNSNYNGTMENYPNGKMMENSIAYISLPMFVSNNGKLIALYADSIQNMIARFDEQNPNGYIIDLSRNEGGNCFPMIAGIGPLIGNGVCGLSYSGDGTVKKLIYNEGWTGRDSNLVFQKIDPYHMKNTNKPIAVIYGNRTGSSGEVTAIALIALPNAKSFGQKTYGASTRIDNFELSDGSYLNLASGVDADRNGNKFGREIKPDVETKDTMEAISEAVKWILGVKE